MTTRPRPLVALLEARMSLELRRLVERHGGRALSVPALVEGVCLSQDAARDLIELLCHKQPGDAAIFMTGVSVAILFERADQLGRRTELVHALRRLITICRGPKPAAALRGFGVPPTLTAASPYTTAELIDVISDLELQGRTLTLLQCGQRSGTLAETLLARGVRLREVWLYRWSPPEDASRLESLVTQLITGNVDAIAITCQIQFTNLLATAERMNRAEELIEALTERVVVGVVGPTCRAVLEAHGIRPDVEPEHPKMGPLVSALLRHLQRTPTAERSVLPQTTLDPLTH